MGLGWLVRAYDFKTVYVATLAGVAYFALAVADKVVGAHRGAFVTAACLLFNSAR